MFPSKTYNQIKLKRKKSEVRIQNKKNNYELRVTSYELNNQNSKFKIGVALCIFFLSVIFCSCFKKSSALEEKVSVKKNNSNVMNENKYQYDENNVSTKLYNDSEINLNKNFQTSGRANPFVPLGGSTGGTTNTAAPSSSGGQPIFNTNQTQNANTIMSSTLPPLPNQAIQSVSAPEVPQWPTQPPILSASPATRLDSMVHLTLKGVIYSKTSGKKLAIIEEKGGIIGAVLNPKMTGGSAGAPTITTRSYILQENETFTEYSIKVVKILAESVELQRGNQKISLSLKLTPSQDFIPLDVPTLGGVVQEGKISSSMVR